MRRQDLSDTAVRALVRAVERTPLIEGLERRRLLASTLISLTNMRDVVYDDTRNYLYVTTSSGAVQRYDAVNKALLPSFAIGSSLNGADITADGSSLYVADGTVAGTQGFFRKVNLSTGSVTSLPYTLTFGEAGAWDVSIANNGRALVTTSYAGSGWTPLRQIDLATDAMTTRTEIGTFGEVRQNTSLARGFDRSGIFLQESNISSGPIHLYDAASNTFPKSADTSTFVGGVAGMSRDGQLIAMRLSGASVMDRNLATVKVLSSIDGGMIFDPKRDVFYGVGSSTDQIIAYETQTWSELYRLSIGENVGTSGSMGAGNMAIDDDGTKIFLITGTGVRMIDLPQATFDAASVQVSGFPALIKTGVSGAVTVKMRGPAGEVASNYRGTVKFTSSDPAAGLPADYTFTAADAGIKTFNVTFNNAGAQSITVIDTVNTTLTAAQSGINVHSGNPALIPMSGQRDMVYDDVRDILYLSTSNGTIERFNIATGTLLSPINVGSALNGIDVTSDGEFLYVADAVRGAIQGLFRKIDVDTGAITNLPYNRESLEGGAWDVAIMNNGKALVTTTFEGSGWTPLREINLATDVLTTHAAYSSVRQSSLVNRGFDRGRVLLQESNSSGGPIGALDVATGTWTKKSTNTFVAGAPAAVSRDGTLMAMRLNGVTIMSPTLGTVTTLSGIDGGMIFDSKRDVFYGVNSTSDQIVAYDTNTWQEKYRLAVGENVGSAASMGAGQMSADDAGTKLFLTTAAGVRVFAIPQPDGVAASVRITGFSRFIKSGVSSTLTVELLDGTGAPATTYRGTVRLSSTDAGAVLHADYTFTAADNGKKTFSATLKTVGTHSLTVTDVGNGALVGSQTGIQVHNGASLIPVTNRRDLVFDPVRKVLYITTSAGTIERYDTLNQTLLAPIQVGSALNGADITVDGYFLYVADAVRGPTQGQFRKVNLTTGAVSSIPYDLDFGEGAAWDVGIASNGLAFVTTRYEGSGWTPLRTINLATDAIAVRSTPFGEVNQDTHIARGADRSLMFFTESNISSGPAFTYAAGSDTVSTQKNFNMFHGSTISAVNRNGTVIAMEQGTGTTIMDATMTGLTTLSTINGGVVFDPNKDLLYGVDTANDRIVAYDTTNWSVMWQMAIGENATGSTPLGDGVMSVSPDGLSLFLSTPTGVRTFSLAATPIISGFPTATTAGASSGFTVTARDPQGNFDPTYRGTVRFTSSDPNASLPADYTFTAADNGVHTFSATLNSVATSHLIVVADLATGNSSSQAGIFVSGVGLSGGVLNVIGTSAADSLSLKNTGGTVTSILNGVTSTFAAAAVTSLNVQLLGGADTFNFNNGYDPTQAHFLIPGTMNLGAGADTLVLATGGGSGLITVQGDTDNDWLVINDTVTYAGITYDGGTGIDKLNYTTASGNDVVTVSSSAFTFAGRSYGYTSAEDLTVTTGAGNDTVTVASLLSTQALMVNGESGADVLNLNGGTGPVTFNGGADADTLNVGQTYTGTFTYNDSTPGHTGNDALFFTGAETVETYTISTNAMTLASRTSYYYGVETINVNARGGNDSINLSTNGANVALFTVDGGEGADTMWVQGTAATKRVTMLGGNGNDTMELIGGYTTPSLASFDGQGGTDKFNLFAGGGAADVIDVNTSSMTIGALTSADFTGMESLSVQAYNGNDIINVAAASVPITVMGEAGNDTINLGTGAAGLNAFAATVTASGDLGTDTLNLNDQPNGYPDAYTFGPTTLARTAMATISYFTFEATTLNASAAGNIVNVHGVAALAALVLNLGGGDDTVNLTDAAANNSTISLNGEGGSDTFNYALTNNTPITLNNGGGDTLNITAGHVSLANDTGGLAVNVSGRGQLTMTASQPRLAALRVEGGGHADLAGGGKTLTLGDLHIGSGGCLDLHDGHLMLDTAASAPEGTFPAELIEGWIASGRNGGAWDGDGIITTAAAAQNGLTILGVGEASQLLGISGNQTAVWNGQTVDATTVIVRYTYAGDANLDGLISGDDYSAIDFAIVAPGASGWANGDFNYDGIISGDDYSIIDFNIAAQGQPIMGSQSAEVATRRLGDRQNVSEGTAASIYKGIVAVPEPRFADEEASSASIADDVLS